MMIIIEIRPNIDESECLATVLGLQEKDSSLEKMESIPCIRLEALFEIGVGKSPELTMFTKEETDKYFGVRRSSYSIKIDTELIIFNREIIPDQIRGAVQIAPHGDLGWKPAKTTKDMLESIQPEVVDNVIVEN
ncbi:hypothetical protein BDQ17DRAFT_1432759 [Cyathus striatus]|nr:hypothetical protein BDQ17DRAFT_1432759 [Cyathus striatus]